MKNLKLLALVAALASTTAFDANAAMRRSRTPQAQSVETPSPRFQEPAVQRQDSSSSSQSQEDISSYRVVPNSPQALVLFPNQDQPKAFGSPQLVQFFNLAAESKTKTAQLTTDLADAKSENEKLNKELLEVKSRLEKFIEEANKSEQEYFIENEFSGNLPDGLELRPQVNEDGLVTEFKVKDKNTQEATEALDAYKTRVAKPAAEVVSELEINDMF